MTERTDLPLYWRYARDVELTHGPPVHCAGFVKVRRGFVDSGKQPAGVLFGF